MTQTTNYNLKKIDSADNWRDIFADHNDSMDAIDSGLNTLANQVDSIVQQSAFSIVEENGTYALYWYGAAGECPYTIVLENGAYVLYYNYTTA